MLSLPELVRIYVCTQPTDMRKSFDSLAAVVRDWLGYDPLSGHLFVFRSRRGDRVKLLWWDRDGLTLYYRRLEEGTFRFPDGQRSRGAEHRGLGAGVVAGAVGHRPGQREAAEALSAHGVTRGEKISSGGGIFSPRSGIYKGMSTDALPLPDPALLPDDPAVLKQLVVQLLEELQKANARLERQEHHMHLLLKRIYGSTSEKFDPRQGVLFDPQAGEEETAAKPARTAAGLARRLPRTATGTAAGGFPTRSSVRKSFTI